MSLDHSCYLPPCQSLIGLKQYLLPLYSLTSLPLLPLVMTHHIPACTPHHLTTLCYVLSDVFATCCSPLMKRTNCHQSPADAYLWDIVPYIKVIGATIQSPNAFALLNMCPSLKICPTIPLLLPRKMFHFFSHQCLSLFQPMHLRLHLLLLPTPVFLPQFLQMFRTPVLRNKCSNTDASSTPGDPSPSPPPPPPPPRRNPP